MSLTTSEMKTLKALVHEHSQSRHPVKLMIVQAACNVRSESAREGVATDLGRLKAKGYVVRVVGNRWVPTPSGKQAVGYPAFSTKIASPKAVSEPCTEQAEKLDDAPVTDEQPNTDKDDTTCYIDPSYWQTDLKEASTRSAAGVDGLVNSPVSAASRVLQEEAGLVQVTDGDGTVRGIGVFREALSKPTAQGILDRAGAHMRDRAATYDKPEGERSMGATVGAFREVTGLVLTEEQGWLFMSLLKAVRSQQGGYRADSYEDGVAYFALAGEAAGRIRQ